MFRFIIIFTTVFVFSSFSIMPVQSSEEKVITQPRAVQKSSLIGQTVPDFTLPTFLGETQTLSEMSRGKRTLIYFWATWCANCHEKLTYFQGMRETFQKKNIELVVVNLGDDVVAVEEYMSHHQLTLDTFLDRTSTLEKKFQLNALPTIVFVTPEGVVMNVTHSLPKKASKTGS